MTQNERLHIDIESFSECDLKAAGMYAYAEHASTEVLVVGFGLAGWPVHLWVPRWDLPDAIVQAVKAKMDPGATLYIQPEAPELLLKWIASGKKLAAHNAGFERAILNGHAGQAIGFPRIEIGQWICTAAKARAHGLPGALGAAAEALGTYPKKEDGKPDMMRLTKPKKPSKADPSTRYTPETAPEKFISLYLYNIDDVRAEQGVDGAVPDLPESEQRVWELDQKINDRGVRVDLPAIADVQFLIAEYKTELEALCLEWTGFKPTQREKIAEWIRKNGWPHLTDLQAETVNNLTVHPDVPHAVKNVLRLYSTYGMKAVSKYEAMKEAACVDDRIRGMFIYHGGGPGRWSSMIVQLQNLFRPVIKDADVAIEAFVARDLAWVRELYA